VIEKAEKSEYSDYRPIAGITIECRGRTMKRCVAICVATIVVANLVRADDARSTAEMMNQAWLAAHTAADFDRLAALYTEDAILMPAGGEPVRGREAIRRFFAEDFKYIPRRSITLKSLRVEASGSVLVDSGEYRYDGIDTEGKPLHITGNYNTVMKKTDGKWHTAIDIWNVRTPEEGKK
jgi:uncharacterized protein (TIGR02246 family)